MMNSIFNSINQASREFDYDYIFIDAFFLTIWLSVLVKQKKWNPLKYGFVTSIIVYIIDAIIWWNAPAGPNYPPGTTIREYWIGGVKIPHPLGEYFWVKSGADFMMCISYSLFAFGWLWIMFENYIKRNIKEMVLYTSLFFGSWMLTPFLSSLIPINDTIVYTIRYMDTQLIVWFINVFIGYGLLFLIYGTGKFRKKDYKLIGYVFMVGVLESAFMEIPLFIFQIRPMKIFFLIYELFFLFNQGAPYLWILQMEVLPFVFGRLKNRRKKDQIIELVAPS